MDNEEKELKELKAKVELIDERRITQTMIMPGGVKQRHMGEPNSYITAGLEADLPTGVSVTFGTIIYFATDTSKLYIWNGTAFKSVTLS